MDSSPALEPTDAKGEVSNKVEQPNSFDSAKFKEDILNSVKELISDPRTTQSQKDKLISEIKKDKGLKDYLREIQSMREAGMSDKEIELEARLREIEETRNVQNSIGNVVQKTDNSAVKVLAQALNLDLNDPEVVQVLLKPSNDEQILGLSNIAQKRKVEPNPALIGTSGGSSKEPDLMEEYRAKADKTRGDALIKLKMEYRKKGLNIT